MGSQIGLRLSWSRPLAGISSLRLRLRVRWAAGRYTEIMRLDLVSSTKYFRFPPHVAPIVKGSTSKGFGYDSPLSTDPHIQPDRLRNRARRKGTSTIANAIADEKILRLTVHRYSIPICQTDTVPIVVTSDVPDIFRANDSVKPVAPVDRQTCIRCRLDVIQRHTELRTHEHTSWATAVAAANTA